MPKTINIQLSTRSLEAAIREIYAYRDSFERKVDTYMERLKEIGLDVVRCTVAGLTDDEIGSTTYAGDWNEDHEMVIRLSGDKALFIEFGAGITYSNPQHPKAGEMRMGVGTWPDQKHAFDPAGWWYAHDKHSYGNPAYMPLYKAGEEIRQQAVSIAREVFGS